MSLELTGLQKEVVEAARRRLMDKPWFRGVCLDCMPTDAEILRHRQRSIDDLVANTEYWDA